MEANLLASSDLWNWKKKKKRKNSFRIRRLLARGVWTRGPGPGLEDENDPYSITSLQEVPGRPGAITGPESRGGSGK